MLGSKVIASIARWGEDGALRVLWPSALVAAIATVAFFVVTSAGAAGTNLDQCSNGSPRFSPAVCDWQNGNLNSSNSEYAEGDVIPYRLFITDLDPGVHTIDRQRSSSDSQPRTPLRGWRTGASSTGRSAMPSSDRVASIAAGLSSSSISTA